MVMPQSEEVSAPAIPVAPVTDGSRAITQGEILALLPPLRRFVASRVGDPQEIDDVVQETLTRLLAARSRLDSATLMAYAFTVARNQISSQHRAATLTRRHAPKMIDLTEPGRPDEALLEGEDRRALGHALAQLPADQRDMLLAHVVDDVPLAELATTPGSSGSLAAKMSRTRAKLRLDYVLALRQVTLPTPRCRPVLLAVSAGDTRRQATLRAGRHVLTCGTCATLADPLLRRERALAVALPFLAVGAAWRSLVALVRLHPAASGTTALAGAAATAALVVGMSGPAQPAAPAVKPAAEQTVLDGPAGPVLPMASRIRTLVGETVRAHGVRVLAVPADEGFWVGRPGSRVWVQLVTEKESSRHVRAGERLTFSARVVANKPDFVDRVYEGSAAGRRELERQHAHLSVRLSTIVTDR
jgi:RNA polymerase sigma factor (sigma-70 family)